MNRLLIVILALAAAVAGVASNAVDHHAVAAVRAETMDQPRQGMRSADPTQEPAMPPFPFQERLAPPPTVYPPSQADEGAQIYYLVCMACHGDKGQGLTEEWRNVLSPEDRNCWQSKCHASNHPLEGFKMPEYVPPVVGPGLISVFGDAANLHKFLKARMPWQAPGSLSDEEYWQLTAFLIRENGFELGMTTLGEDSAKLFSLQPLPTPTPEPMASSAPLLLPPGTGFWTLIGIAILLLAGLTLGGFLIRRLREVRSRPESG